jgi:sulfite reductase (ferredoxin)
MAELGFVGSAPDSYQLWLGGTTDQTRLASAYIDKMAIDDLEKILEPLFVYFRKDKRESETFGEFCHRVGFAELQGFSATYVPAMTEAELTPAAKARRIRKNQNRVSVPDDMFVRLKQAAEAEKRPMNQIINEALETYFAKQS